MTDSAYFFTVALGSEWLGLEVMRDGELVDPRWVGDRDRDPVEICEFLERAAALSARSMVEEKGDGGPDSP